MNKIFYTWNDFFNDIEDILSNNDVWTFASVYGVPRGGIPLALILSQRLNITFIQSEDEIQNHTLIVDDIIDSGLTRNKHQKNNFLSLHSSINFEKNPPLFPEDKTNIINKGINGWIVYPWESNEQNGPEENIVRIMEAIGEDPNREGLRDTPKRVIKSWNQLYSGYNIDPKEISTTFSKEKYDEIILLKDIEMYSMCEHHMLPFIGKAHIGYIPKEKIIGISKLARILEIYSRRLQIQERLTNEIVDCVVDLIDPIAVGCVIEANHLCTRMRGVNKQNSVMTTSALRGSFLEDSNKGRASREEFMRLIGK